MGFTTEAGRVEINVFKPTGKWYAQGSVDMHGFYTGVLLHDALLSACVREFERGESGQWPVKSSPRELLAQGWTIVCFEPYHEHGHPTLLRLRCTDEVLVSSPDEPQREYRLKALLTLLQDSKLRDEAAQLFHSLWGDAANRNYDKEGWKKLQSLFGM
jgi:hypothetical protein